MNITETKALNWLNEQGAKDVVFHQHNNPDFTTSNMGNFEVKRLCNGQTICFRKNQFAQYKHEDNLLILVYPKYSDGNEPFLITTFDDLVNHQNCFKIAVQNDDLVLNHFYNPLKKEKCIYSARVRSQNRVKIPKEVCAALGIFPGSTILVSVSKTKQVENIAAT